MLQQCSKVHCRTFKEGYDLKIRPVSLTLTYSLAPRYIQAASPSSWHQDLSPSGQPKIPWKDMEDERHQLSWSSHLSWALWRLVVMCLSWICLFLLFRSWQGLASPSCPTLVSHTNLLTVLVSLFGHPEKLHVDVLRSWWPANWGTFLQSFCCCLHARHPFQPHTRSTNATSFHGRSSQRDKSWRPLSFPITALQMTMSWWHFRTNPSPLSAGMQSSGCIPTFHKPGQIKHLKHNTHLRWKVWDTGTLCCSHPSFESLKCCCWELQPWGFVRLYSYNHAHGFQLKKHCSVNYIHSTSSLQISCEDILIGIIQSTADFFLEGKSFQTCSRTCWSGLWRAGINMSRFPLIHPRQGHLKGFIFRLC